jgi:hypothetical protein
MRLRILLPGLLALVFFVACAPPPELRDPNLLQDNSLLTDEPCAAPCWRGITPGETEWNDALTIIEDDPTLTDPQTQADENSGAVIAEFQQLDTNVACCQMFSEVGQVVDIVFLRTAPTVSVGEVIEAKGEPSYLLGTPFSDDQAIMNLIYPDIPMVLYAFVEGTTGSLSEDSPIIGILYMKPSDMELLLQTSDPGLQAWEGYQSYQYYDESELEITPSITLTPTPGG